MPTHQPYQITIAVRNGNRTNGVEIIEEHGHYAKSPLAALKWVMAANDLSEIELLSFEVLRDNAPNVRDEAEPQSDADRNVFDVGVKYTNWKDQEQVFRERVSSTSVQGAIANLMAKEKLLSSGVIGASATMLLDDDDVDSEVEKEVEAGIDPIKYGSSGKPGERVWEHPVTFYYSVYADKVPIVIAVYSSEEVEAEGLATQHAVSLYTDMKLAPSQLYEILTLIQEHQPQILDTEGGIVAEAWE
jgi:hypothetical protein